MTEGAPILEDCSETYYQYWQVFQVTEIHNMMITTVANLRDSELLQLAGEGKAHLIPLGRKRETINLRGIHSLREFPNFVPAFEVLAYYYSYSKMAQFKVGIKAKNQSQDSLVTFDEEEHSKLVAEVKVIACEAIDRWQLHEENILEFIKWQCKRWDEWTRLDRQLIAGEYKKNINAAIDFYMLLSGKQYEEVVANVGRVMGHFKPSLDVILPQWITEQKEAMQQVFKDWIWPTLESYKLAGLNLKDGDREAFVDWVVNEEHFQFLWHIEQVNKCWQFEDPVSLTVLAKTVEGLSNSFEHILNGIVLQSKDTLFKKVKWLWSDDCVVLHLLGENSELSRSDSNFDEQWRAIDSFPESNVRVEIVRDFLKAILIRNHGTHLGFKLFYRERLLGFAKLLLRVVIVTWWHARSRGLLEVGN